MYLRSTRLCGPCMSIRLFVWGVIRFLKAMSSSSSRFHVIKNFAIRFFTVDVIIIDRVRIRDLDKLYLIKISYGGCFRLQSIFATAPAALKMILDSKMVKSDSKIIIRPLSKAVTLFVPYSYFIECLYGFVWKQIHTKLYVRKL